MTRLIVKNVAKSVTVDKLKEVFSEKGVVTDVQLKYTANGKFRHFGFVGFKNEEDALQALEYFNNTFINGSRVKVEQCAQLGDPNKPKSWSKYASDSSAYQKIHGQKEEIVKKEEDEQNKKKENRKNDSGINEVLKKYENDPVFSEFMQARSKGKLIWSNDNVADDNENQKKEKKQINSENKKSGIKTEDNEFDAEDDTDEESDDQDEPKIAKADISDMEYLKMKIKGETDLKKSGSEEIHTTDKKSKGNKSEEVFFTVKVRGIKFNSKKKDIKQFFHPLKPKSIRLPGKMKGIAFVGFGTEKEMKIALKKDRSFLVGRRIFVSQYGGDVKHSLKVKNVNHKWEEQAEGLKNEEDVSESGRIFVRNLAYTVVENDIELLFSKYGPLTEVVMPIDRVSRKPKGFAIVTFLMPEHAVKAYMELDGSVLHGRMVHLIPGKNKKSIEEMLEMEGLTFKQKKALKQKAQAAATTNNWNTLFLGSNAVADLIAKNYNTTKEQVLDVRSKESLAVRLALGETQIVNETKQFLEDNGVHLNAFNQPSTQRSKTVILVKNLPAETKGSEIYQLFSKFGELGRVLLPPSGATAIVEFLEPSEARGAFRKLAYSKFKYVPLYLEWAPENAFSTPFSKKNVPNIFETPEAVGVNSKNDVSNEELQKDEQGQTLGDKNSSSDEEEDEPPEPDTTLFIKNLNFKTREDGVREHFKKCGPIHNITVVMKKDPKNPGQFLSCGYGFIQFKRKTGLEKALKSYQSSVLDEHSLELKRSNRTLQTDLVTARKTTKIGKQIGSKILVRNIPFQATHREVRELFKTFGEIKALRLPQKMAGTGSHRGFAFVEYFTKHDAKRAFKALCQSTHLYGRRLVLEWANSEDNVSDLRRKTANQFMDVSSNYQRSKGTVNFDIEVEAPEPEQVI